MIELTRLWPDDDKRDDGLLRLLVAVHGYEPPQRLSPSHRRVLECASRGLDWRESAELLAIAPYTVREHLKQARRVLRAKNTAHACCEALRQGLIR